MFDCDGLKNGEGLQKNKLTTVFTDLASEASAAYLAIFPTFNSKDDKTMMPFGNLTLENQESDFTYSAYEAGNNAGAYILQKIKDSTSHDHSTRDDAIPTNIQNDISREIRGLSTLQNFDFRNVYNEFQYELLLCGDHDALTAVQRLDQSHKIRDELDKDFLQLSGSDKADQIHNSVDVVLKKLLLANSKQTHNSDDLNTIIQQVKSDLGQLTTDEQEVYRNNLFFELHTHPELENWLGNPEGPGYHLYWGGLTYDVPSTNAKDNPRPALPASVIEMLATSFQNVESPTLKPAPSAPPPPPSETSTHPPRLPCNHTDCSCG